MESDQDPDECMQCGLCCKIFGDKIFPTQENLYSWMTGGRTDILRFFMARRSDGGWVPCTELSPSDLGDVHAVEMRDPSTGGYLPACPFLRRVSRSRYLCGIHPEKPEMCRNYQPWIWGETFFNRCRALRKREEASQWSGVPD